MKRTIPRTIPTLSNQSNGQQQAPPLKSRTRVLGLVSPQLSSQASKVTPYQSSDHAQEVLLDYEIQSIDRQLAEAVSEREQKHEQAKGLEEYPPRDTPANIGVAALGAGLVGLAFFSWLNSGQYVAMNFTDTFGQALLFCSVIPVIPFAMKYFINGMLGSQRRCVELILAGLFLVSSAVFADQFAQLFAKKEGITITAPAFDFGGNDSGEAPTPPAEDPYAPVSLRGFFFGQLSLEWISSYALFSWLLGSLALHRNPRLVTREAEIVQLTEHVASLESIRADLHRQQAELRHRKAAYESLMEEINDFIN